MVHITNVSSCVVNVSSTVFEGPPDAPILETCLSAMGAIVDLLIIGLVIIEQQAQTLNNNLLLVNLLSSYWAFNVMVFISSIAKIDIIDYSTLVVIVSVLALCTITIDRVITIKFPFRYKSQQSWMICLEVAMCWICPALYYVVQISLVGPKLEYRATMLVSVPIAGAAVLLVANSLTFVVARSQYEKIIKTTVKVVQKRPRCRSNASEECTRNNNNNNNNNSNNYESCSCSADCCSTVSGDALKDSKDVAKLKSEIQLVYSCFELVILFSVSWLPMSLYLLFTMRSLHGMMPGYTYLLRMPIYLNAIITPLVYILRCRKLRKAIYRRWCCLRKGRMTISM